MPDHSRRFSLVSVSHVSDLLKSLERRPLESRPTVSVVGAMLAEGIMLGEAIQFANESRWYDLFPISRSMKAMQLAREAQTALAAEPLPKFLRDVSGVDSV